MGESITKPPIQCVYVRPGSFLIRKEIGFCISVGRRQLGKEDPRVLFATISVTKRVDQANLFHKRLTRGTLLFHSSSNIDYKLMTAAKPMDAQNDDNGIGALTLAADPASDVLLSHGLTKGADGFVRWAKNNPDHPRNWSFGRKCYDTSLIIFLDFFTSVCQSIPC